MTKPQERQGLYPRLPGLKCRGFTASLVNTAAPLPNIENLKKQAKL